MAKAVIVLLDSLPIMIAVIILTVLMEVEEKPAVQAPTNVEQGKEIVTRMVTALAV